MKIGFLVNSISLEKSKYTSVRLAVTAINRGHEVWFMGVGDLSYDSNEQMKAVAKTVAEKKYKSSKVFLKDLKSEKHSIKKTISLEELDVLLLRNDPSIEPNNRAWARYIGLDFARLAARKGVIVLNDPNGLAKAMDKMYFMQFPQEIRPKTIITRNRNEIKKFAKEYDKVVLKPLLGSGGKNVFLIDKTQISNINQIIDVVSMDGYIVAQEYLNQAEEGDTRLFLMNGVPLKYKGKYAAFKRIRSEEDLRSNVHAGGKVDKAEINSDVLKVAEIVRPKLCQDGMFFAGLDIVGDKILEINVFSPGGLGKAQEIEKVNFTPAFIQALEKKVKYMKYYNRKFDNTELTTL